MKKYFSIVLFVLLFITGCEGQSQQKQKQKSETQTIESLKLPDVPIMLQSPEERAAYVVKNYWTHFNFADTTLIGNEQYTEQAFANYIDILPHTSIEVASQSIASMLGKAMDGDQAMFDHFAELYEKYLYDPNSPMRNEDYYIAVLRAVIDNDKVEEINKMRPRHLLETALKNRVGDVAADFDFQTKEGQKTKLSKIAAKHTILFFNNPDCHDCARVKGILAQLQDPDVKVVAIYPDSEVELWQKTEYPSSWVNGQTMVVEQQKLYDLRAIPTLYLLDAQKCVVLKDATIEKIMEWLQDNQ